MYRYLISLFIIGCISLCGFSQNESGVRVKEGGYGLIKTNITVTYDHTWGDISDSFKARVAYELIKKKSFSLTANANYSSITADFESNDLPNWCNMNDIDINGTHLSGGVGLTATTRTDLFGKPFIGMAMLNTEFGESWRTRVSGIAMGIFMLRADKDTQFGLGPIVLINSSSKVPAFVVFMYRHRFDEKWMINLYGGMFGIDYTPTANDLIAIGADIESKSFYFQAHCDGLPRHCRFTRTGFRPMAKYRRRLIQNLYLEFEAGYSINMSSRVTGINGSKRYLKMRHQNPVPFAQVSLSYSL